MMFSHSKFGNRWNHHTRDVSDFTNDILSGAPDRIYVCKMCRGTRSIAIRMVKMAHADDLMTTTVG
jgi:hypothetical protein